MTLKPPNISVFEFDFLKVGTTYNGVEFTDDHLSALERFMGNQATPYYTLINKGVRFCEYVGVLQVGNLTIEVLPKADKGNNIVLWRKILISMLRKVGIFDIKAPSAAHLRLKPNHLLDLYFEMFISEAEQLLHRGLIKKYRKEQGNLYSLKGNIKFSRNIQQNLVHQERFYTEHTVYDKCHPLNQVILKTLHLIRRINRNINLNSRIGAILLDFPELPDYPITETWFNTLVYDRKTEQYRKAIEIARLLLLNYHPDISHGRNHVLALMFDMNVLWEKFVYVSLRKNLQKDDYEIHAQQAKPYWKLTGYRPVTLRPDIIIQKGELTYVLDTKWKMLNSTKPSPADLHQMYAYTKYFKATHTLLVYPGENDFTEGFYYHETNNEPACKCSVVKIGVDEHQDITEWQSIITKRIQGIIDPTPLAHPLHRKFAK